MTNHDTIALWVEERLLQAVPEVIDKPELAHMIAIEFTATAIYEDVLAEGKKHIAISDSLSKRYL